MTKQESVSVIRCVPDIWKNNLLIKSVDLSQWVVMRFQFILKRWFTTLTNDKQLLTWSWRRQAHLKDCWLVQSPQGAEGFSEGETTRRTGTIGNS